MRESLAYIQTDLVRTLPANILREVFPHTLIFLPTEPYLLKICKRLQKSYLNTGFKDCWLLEALR